MRAFLLGMVLAAGTALLPEETTAQNRPSPNCTDDRGVDRCAAEQQQRVRELFGVPPIEELQASGAQVRRVFYVDGYGRDMVAISFVRAPGRDPTLYVHFPREGDTLPTPATALVPMETWERVMSGAAHFDQALASESAEGDAGVVRLCLHSWVYTVEASDPAVGRPGQIRRDVEDACEDGLAEPYARELAQLALTLLPYCAALDRTLHRNEASMLHACALLEGDRLAAADGFNRALRLSNVDRRDESLRALQAFESTAVLEWEGQVIEGDGNRAASAWIERVIGQGRSRFYIRRVIGDSAHQVRVEGQMSRTRDTPGGQQEYQTAPVALILESRPWNPSLSITRATVGTFAAADR